MCKDIGYVCHRCGDEFYLGADDDPYEYEDGVLCDDCNEELNEFRCCLCQENGDVEDQHNMVVIIDEEGVNMPRGVYMILEYPYYSSDMFSMWLDEWALERIGDTPKDADGDGYPCGHLCIECQKKLMPPLFTSA
jgi:hypothetical protein